MVDLLYLFLTVRKVECSWSARHRDQHATMSLIRSLLAYIITLHAVFSGMLAWLRNLIKQLLLWHRHHVVLIIEAEAVQAIGSHALLTSARLARLWPYEFVDSAACKYCPLSRASLSCLCALMQLRSQFQLWIRLWWLRYIRELPIRCITHIHA